MKNSSMKRIVVLFLALVMLMGTLVVTASADETHDWYYYEQYYRADSHGRLRSFADYKIVIDTSDLAVVFRFYEDGSTAVYYTGEAAAQVKKWKDELIVGGFGTVTFNSIEPKYLRAGLELGYARLRIRSTYGQYSNEYAEEFYNSMPDRLKPYFNGLDPSNNATESIVTVPVLNYDDVPEGTTLTLVKTNYVEPPTPEEIAEKERQEALIEASKNADLTITMGYLPYSEKEKYSLSNMRIGIDYSKKTVMLLDEDLNEIPSLLESKIGTTDKYRTSEMLCIFPIEDDLFIRAYRDGFLNVRLLKSTLPGSVLEYAPVECIDLSDDSFIFDELNLYEHPEIEAVVESYFPMTLEGARIVVNYLDVGADHDVCELLIQRADGKVLYKDGNAFNNGILYGIFPVKDGKIDDCMENMNALVAKGVKEGHLTVLLRLPQKYGRYSSSGEYYGVELMEVPVIAIGAKPIEIGQSATAQLDSHPLESSKSVENIALRGDVDGNGVLNAKDIVWVMKAIVGYELTGDLSLADFNGDGKLNNRDVIDMMYAAVGK